jgi:hypothetical protein
VHDTYINFNDDIDSNSFTSKIGKIEDFFRRPSLINNIAVDKKIFQMNHCHVLDRFQTLLKVKPLDNSNIDCVIHIRSGDIFKSNINENYTQPPLHYYTSILKANSFKNVYLIAEDKLNPVINKLLSLYPCICFNLQNLEDDIKLLISAKTVVSGIGTFTPSLLMCTSNCSTIYSSHQDSLKFYEPYLMCKKIEVIHYCYKDYYTKMGKWNNSDEQKNFMLTYAK